MLNFDAFFKMLPTAGVGMLGVFIVIGVIIAFVYALNAISGKLTK